MKFSRFIRLREDSPSLAFFLVLAVLAAAFSILSAHVQSDGREEYIAIKAAHRSNNVLSHAVAESILFAGDAGNSSERSLQILRDELSASPKPQLVVFLGDNAYPSGIMPPDSSDYAQSKDRLMRQINVVKSSGVRALFIPGNHDWNDGKEGGWAAVMREQAIVESELGGGSFAPQSGCPGPVEVYLSKHIRIIALDSVWWMRSGDKPLEAGSGCETYSVETVLAELSRLLHEVAPGRRDILLSHHPLESVGPHARGHNCPEDFGCPGYTTFRAGVLSVLRESPPFLCAAGHDHSLQFIESEEGCAHYLVSGSLTNPTGIRPRPDLLAAFSEPGVIRLDVLSDESATITLAHFSNKSGKLEHLRFTVE